MNDNRRQLHQQLNTLAQEWLAHGLPSFSALMATADRLVQWKSTHNVTGVWEKGPVMVTATLDDALGQGLQIIEHYTRILGVTVHPAGLHLGPEQVMAACRKWQPLYLGLTVLQFDTEDYIRLIREKISRDIRIIAGGPVFSADPGLAARAGIDFVAPNLAAFIVFMLNWPETTP